MQGSPAILHQPQPLLHKNGLQPVPQTPLTTSSSVTTRDSLSELDSPLAAPSVDPLQGRGLNK